MNTKPSFWRDLAMKAKKHAKIAKKYGCDESAAQELRFAAWCMQMDREFG